MDGKLQDIAKHVSTAIQRRSRQMYVASISLKVGLIALGSLVVAIVQCAGLPKDGPWPALSISGIAAAIMVFVGSILILLMDEDASKHLALAEDAISRADALKAQLVAEAGQYDVQWQSLERSTALYYALMAMRGALERMPLQDRSDEGGVIDTLLQVADPQLQVGMGLEITDNYTICVYRAEKVNSQTILRLIAHKRALDCDVSQARTWAEGVGAAGMAYARGRELVLPDMLDPALSTLRDRKPPKLEDAADALDEEADPYMSIVAVPIAVGTENKKWGVVVVTSDVRNHFTIEPEPGVRTSEGARALAGMVALALSPNHSPAGAQYGETESPESDPQPAGKPAWQIVHASLSKEER
ncbi:MAG: hypothetical protein JWP49_2132 [Phenylobacterium sp.]|nr:hypothetical protein [Phenylobacterium sp.]